MKPITRSENIVDHINHIYSYSIDPDENQLRNDNEYLYEKNGNSYVVIANTDDIIEKYNLGCLPSMYHDRFEMRRSVRINLNDFILVREHRQVNRKIGNNFSIRCINKDKFDLWDNEEFIKLCIDFAKERYTFGGTITREKIQNIKNNKLINKVLIFENGSGNLGYVFLCDYYPIAHYWYCFYNLDVRFNENIPLGKFIMGKTMEYFHEKNYKFLYLGTAYNGYNTYKIRGFANIEYWNGNNFVPVKKHDSETWD